MLNLTVTTGEAHRDPSPAFELPLSLSAQTPAHLALYGGYARLTLNPISVGFVPIFGAAGSLSSGPIAGRITVPLLPSFVRRVSAARGADGHVRVTGHAFVLVATVPLTASGAFVFSPLESPLDIAHEIARDPWLRLLEHAGHDEVEVFELPKRAIAQHPALVPALELLRSAEERHRNADARGCLARCREAFEHLATTFGKTQDIRAGSNALWEALTNDEQFRAALNDVVGGTKSLLHLGRHAREQIPDVTLDDSLFALRHTLALFELVSRRLAATTKV